MTSKNQFGGPFGSSTNKVEELKEVLKGRKDPSKTSHTETAENNNSQELDSLKKQIEELQNKLTNAGEELKKEKHEKLRVMADFDNARKRLTREQEESMRYGNEKLIKEFLPIFDSLEMTILHSKERDISETNPILEGLDLILKQVQDLLIKFGVSIIEGYGKPFDPHTQEAIGKVENPEVAPGHVALVHRKGYLLFDRVIRPALVSVAETLH